MTRASCEYISSSDGARLAQATLGDPRGRLCGGGGCRSDSSITGPGAHSLPWPSALLCGQPSARWARGKLGLASAGRPAGLSRSLPTGSRTVCSSLPDAWPCPLLCHHHFGRRSTDPWGSPDFPRLVLAGGQGGRGAGRGLGISRALPVSHPFSYGPLGLPQCVSFSRKLGVQTHPRGKEDGERTHGEPHITPRGDCNPCPSSVAGELLSQFALQTPSPTSPSPGSAPMCRMLPACLLPPPAGVRAWPEAEGLGPLQAHPRLLRMRARP